MSVHDETVGAGLGAPTVAPVRARDEKLGLALLVIATAQLMLVLDNTIMNVALPSIQRALHMATANLNWVITAYALAFGGLLLVGGRAGDLFGRRCVFRVGLVLFTLASLTGGLAPTSGVLIGARVAQGIGAAIAAPTALSLLATTFPAGPARNKALGVYGAMGGLGSVVGLVLGGALTEYASWRWVLFINVPIAVAVLIGTAILPVGERDRGHLDLPGAVAATIGFGSLVYAINRSNVDGWADSLTITFLIAGAALLAVFIGIQRTASTPVLPPSVLADRARSGAYAVMFLIGAGMFAMFYFLTLYMQVVRDYSPMHTGLAYLPFAIGIGLAAGGFGPRLLAQMSASAVVSIGLAIAVVGTLWFRLLSPTSSEVATLLPAQFVTGFGLGLAFVTVTIVAVRGVAPRDTGIASGVVNTAQQIGGALGLATLVTVAATVTRHAATHNTRLVALTHGYTAGILVGGALFLAGLVVALLTLRVRVSAQPH